MSSIEKKRITVKLKCPNPLFEEWLTSWKEEAAVKESKMKFTFSNALQSLKKYPLPFESGRDCKILKGFGDKLCKMLDDKLKEYRKEHGEDVVKNGTLPLAHVDCKEVNVKQKASARNSTGLNRGNATHKYIPKYGSGGYAILVTLYRKSLEPSFPGYLKKVEIIEFGKDLVNSSFTKPEPGSRYTAWSSMQTLISKNLVIKVSNPAKFSLTEEGLGLAKKLFENSDSEEMDNNSCDNSAKHSKSNSDDFKSFDIDFPDEFSNEFLQNLCAPENDTFTIDTNKKCLTKYEDFDIPNTKKKCFSDMTTQINFDTNFFTSSSNRNGVESLQKSNGILAKSTNSSQKCNSTKTSTITSFSKNITDSLFDRSQTFESNCGQTIIKVPLQKSLSENLVTSTKAFDTDPSTSSVIFVKSTQEQSIVSGQKHSKNFLNKFASSSSVTSTKSLDQDAFIMAPNNFDIILYVDTSETSGSSNSQSDEVLVGLTKQGIRHEVKDLKVGDFTWICRNITTNQELVLPYIIERKRMDDFAHSIRDKRYHEQKFRLKRSGIENLIYLVESYGKNQHVGLPLSTLNQAATNTAIQENFFIKFTENTRETVEYLCNFSRMLVKMFKNKTLASCPKIDLQPGDMNDDLVSLMTFKEFNESSVKNKRMKITDLFIKMLIQIKGMSVERALAITQRYPTPSILKKEYEKNISGDTGEKLLANIKYGKYGKSIGIMLSKTVYQVFNKTLY